MILPLVAAILAGLIASLALFQIYRPPSQQPSPRWVTALELPVFSGSGWELFLISVAGLFLELLMVRWISSEITIFAYFKNFALIACFLGFGLGAHLCRQPVNLLATLGPMVYLAVLIKLPWPALREVVQKLTAFLGATTEVDVWGVPQLPWNYETLVGLAVTMMLIIPLFALLSLIFIPVGQATGRLLEASKDGIAGYSINIAGSLVGVLLYTALCLFYLPPSVWFFTAGLSLAGAFGRSKRVRIPATVVPAFCVVMTSLPDSTRSVREMVTDRFGTAGGATEWSPYQK